MKISKHFESGIAFMEIGEWENAVAAFTAGIDEDPNNVEYYSQRGVSFLNLEKYDLSMYDFNKALDLDPNYSYRYSCRAFLKARMGDHQGAIEDYEIAIGLDPEDPIIYNNLGLVVEQMGAIKKAKKYFDKSNELEGYNPSKRADEKHSDDSSEKNAAAFDLKEITKENQDISDKPESKSALAKKVFTDKSTFKEFLRFIGNGFKRK